MRLSRNFIWQFLGQGIAKGLGLLFYLLLPRWMGLELYGQFAFALALGLMILQPLLELGLDLVVTKGVSRDRAPIIQDALIIRVIMVGFCLVLLPGLALLGTPLSLLFNLYIYLVLLSFQRLCFAIQRGYERMRLEAIAQALQKGLALLFLVGLLQASFPPLWLGPIALITSTAIATIITGIFTWRDLRIACNQPLNLPQIKATATEGLLLSGVVLLGMIYFRIDTVMLGMMQGDAAVGLYNVAYKLLEGTILLPSVLMTVSFPRLAQPEQFHTMFKKLLALLGSSGLVACGGLALVAPLLISMLYGDTFMSAIPLLQLLSLTLIPIYLGHLATQSLVALDRQRLYLLLTLAAVGVNVVINGVLIPRWGASGAAIATLITESLMMLGCFAGVWQTLKTQARVN